MKSEGPAFAFLYSLECLPHSYAGLPRRIILRRPDCSVFPPATGSRSKSFPAASRWRVRNNLPHTRFSVYTPDAFFSKKTAFFQFFFIRGRKLPQNGFSCVFLPGRKRETAGARRPLLSAPAERMSWRKKIKKQPPAGKKRGAVQSDKTDEFS